MVEVLLAAGAFVDVKGRNGNTALHEALFRRTPDTSTVVQLLLNAGFSGDAANDEGRTPLHEASSCCRLAMIRPLLEAGADVNATDLEGYTPLHHRGQGQLPAGDKPAAG